MIIRTLAALAAVSALAACGGGGGGNTAGPQSPTAPPTTPATTTLKGLYQSEGNAWGADPMQRLPANGTAGLIVERPQGSTVIIRERYPESRDAFYRRLEPVLRHDPENAAAKDRLNRVKAFVTNTVRTAYKQWARHLDQPQQSVSLALGESFPTTCHGSLACYVPSSNEVILSNAWLEQNYQNIWRAASRNDVSGLEAVYAELLWVVTHEAGHQFGYLHPRGDIQGCGTGHRCHAPVGSGSVMSYDLLKGLRARFAPDREDVSRIRNGRWNDNTRDIYTVSRTARADRIDRYGVWLTHAFRVEGESAPGLGAGTLRIVNNIWAQPFVEGRPSENHGLTGTATWSGDFVGIDLRTARRGQALTADADLNYRFSDSRMNLALSGFQGHSVKWGTRSYSGSVNYGLSCHASGCGFTQAGTPCNGGTCGGVQVQAQFYANGGDPSAFVAGVVNDDRERTKFAGSFAAQKDRQ